MRDRSCASPPRSLTSEFLLSSFQPPILGRAIRPLPVFQIGLLMMIEPISPAVTAAQIAARSCAVPSTRVRSFRTLIALSSSVTVLQLPTPSSLYTRSHLPPVGDFNRFEVAQ